jgi:hypothetical protein
MNSDLRERVARAIAETMKRFEHGPIVEEDSIFAADAVLAELKHELAPQAEQPIKGADPIVKSAGVGESSASPGNYVVPAAPPITQPQASAEDDAADFVREASRLLLGFMLDTNAIGPHGAGENLVRGIKASQRIRASLGVGRD